MAEWNWTRQELKSQLDKAERAGRLAERIESRAVAVRYVRSAHKLLLTLRSGVVVTIPVDLLPYFRNASASQLAQVTVSPRGRGLHWKELDVDLSVPALIAQLLEPATAMAELGRVGGRSTSKAKARAARENGTKGGRPRKAATAIGT
jgi:hypothetical protein